MPTPVKQTMTKPAATTQQTAGVLGRIRPLAFAPDEPLSCAFYGLSGTGKTTLWSTFPGPILAILSSGGIKPGELKSLDTPEMRAKISSVAINEAKEVMELAEHAKGGSYKTVVLDHASGLQDQALKELLGLAEIPAQKSWGLATQQQWGQIGLQVKGYLRALINLTAHGVNVVIIAHERGFKEDGESESVVPHVGAAMSPTTTGWLNGAVDNVCQTFIRPKYVTETVSLGKGMPDQVLRKKVPGVEYCLRTAPSETYMTKFRVPRGFAKPDVIVDPTYDKILKIVKGEPL